MKTLLATNEDVVNERGEFIDALQWVPDPMLARAVVERVAGSFFLRWCWLGFWVALWLLPGASAQVAERQVLHGHVIKAVAQLGLPALDELPGATNLDLVIALPLRNAEGLTNLLQQLYDPGSPQHHRWLTPDQFTDQFGPAEADYQAVIEFAKANGFAITGTHSNRTLVDVRGSVSDIERTMRVKLRVYRHPTEAREFYAPDVEPSLDLAVPVLHISGLDNYNVPHPMIRRMSPDQKGVTNQPALGSGPSGNYMGYDFRSAYVPGVALTGVGQMVGLLELEGYYANDIASYEKLTGLPKVTLTNVLVDGFNGRPASDDADGVEEVSLDIEMAIAMAPGLAKVVVYEAPNNGTYFIDLLNRMATDNLAKQLSSSWSVGDYSTSDQVFLQFAAQGQSYFQASADFGAYSSLYTLFPPESPNITLVGGTTLTVTGTGGAWQSESVWNWFPQNSGASGGGISPTYAIPVWQQGIDMTLNQGSTTMRNIPDVALTADGIYVIFENGETSNSGGIGGTSCATPLWAAFTALVNQQAEAAGQPTVGFLNPALYAIGKSANYGACFHDITSGNNETPESPNEFSAVAGYDLCTGWGTPTGSNLINALLPQADLTASRANLTNTTLQAGQTVTPSITITNQSCAGGSVNAGVFHVGFYFSADSSFMGAAAFLETPVSGCPGGGTVTISPSVTIPAGIAPGTSYLGFNINDENEVLECDKNNNFFNWTITVGASTQPPTITTVSPLPAGTVGTAYSQTLSATGGSSPYSWSVSSGNLPPGLSLNTGTGLISGTPTTAATSSFTIQCTGANRLLAQTSFSLTVNGASGLPDLTKGTDNLSNLTPQVGQTVTASLTLTNLPCSGGSAGAGAFHVGFYFSTDSSFSGVTPFFETAVAGCPASGSVSVNQNITISAGTALGTHYLGYKINDENEVAECNDNNNGIFYWTVTVIAASAQPPTITTVSLPAGTAGTAYSQTLAASGGTAPYSWSVSSGNLPPGLSLNASTGLISGTPTTAITASFTIRCTGSNGLFAQSSYSLTVNASLALPNLTKGTDYLNNLAPQPGQTVTASLTITNQSCSGGSAGAGAFHVGFYWSTDSSFSGDEPFYEAFVAGCPATGTVSLNQNIIISVGNTLGTHYLGYKINDENEVAECNDDNSGIFYWTVTVTSQSAQPPTITTDSPLPPGTVGTAYNLTLMATNGTPQYNWSVSSGSLPPGLSLNASTGVISGIPTTAITASFTIRCTGANSLFAATTYRLTVNGLVSESDLTQSSENLNSTTPQIGQSITASITVTNRSCQGVAAAAGPFLVGFYWSTGPSLEGVSPFLEVPVTGCPAAGTVSIDRNFVVTPATTPGTYYLSYNIDDSNQVATCDEADKGPFYWIVTVAAPPVQPLTVNKLQTTVNFNKANADGGTVTGTLDLPPDYSFANKIVTLDIGGAAVVFELNSKGSGLNGLGSFTKPTRNKSTGLWTFTAAFKNGAWQNEWGADGMVNSTIPKPGVTVNLPVTLTLDAGAFLGSVNLPYTAIAGKSGTAK